MQVPFGLESTVEVLTTTRNLAALELLLELVLHGPVAYRQFALESLLERRDRDMLFGLVRNYHLLSETQRERLLKEGPRLSNAIRRGYLDPDHVIYNNACTLIRILPDYEQVSLVVGALMKDSPRKADAVEILRELANNLSVDDERRQAPVLVSPAIRRTFLHTLRDAMRRFFEHRSDVVPEAFLLVNTEDTAEVRKILQSPSEPCHNAVVRILRRSDNPKILRWIYWMLRTRQPPHSVLNIISDRDDPIFVEQLLNRIGIHVEPVVATSLGLIREVRWLQPEHPLLSSMTEQLQAAAIAFAMKTGVPLDQKLEIAAQILDEGHHLARQVTAHSLGDLPGSDANKLIQACLEDHDPEVQLAATLQLRRRGLPNALSLLIRQLDSKDERIRAATQHSLSDYTMARFLRIYERLDEPGRSVAGRVIHKIDPNSLSTLRAEMKSDHRQQKTRAARVIRSLGLSDQLAPELMVTLGDPDYMVRREAIESLAHTTQVHVVEALAAYAQQGHELSAGAAAALEYLQRSARHPALRAAAQELSPKLPSGQ